MLSFVDLMYVSELFSVEELKIVVIEPNWLKTREDLASLNEKYSAIWSAATE